MKNRNRYFATSLIVLLSIAIFAIAGYLQAAETDKGTQEGKTAIMEGRREEDDGWKQNDNGYNVQERSQRRRIDIR